MILLLLLLLLVALVGMGGGLALIRTSTATPSRTHSPRTSAFLAFGGLAWTILIGALLMVAPAYHSSSSMSTPTGEVTTTTSTETLLEHEGPEIIVVLLVPVVIALVGALGRGRATRRLRLGAGAVLAALCLLGAASIGIVYVPAPLLLIIAGVRTDRVERQPAPAAPVP